MNKNLNPGPAALVICGLLVVLFLNIMIGVLMMIAGVVWHFAQQPKDPAA
jgi:hypothetical protein